jgi:hypothetical protein
MGKVCKLLFQKQNKYKRAGSVGQVVEHLPSKLKALVSIPGTEKKNPDNWISLSSIFRSGIWKLTNANIILT